MFSVDNFYTIFDSHYGHDNPSSNNVLCVFKQHGSKDWSQLTHLANKTIWHKVPFYQQVLRGKIIMHDQEPFSLNYACALLGSSEWADIFDNTELLHATIKSGRAPIFCHSEKNSRDVEILEKNYFISCYYWWHGMIARDWFRHWQYHAKLTLKSEPSYYKKFLLYCRSTDGTRQYRNKVVDFIESSNISVKYNKDKSLLVSSEESAKIDINDIDCAIHIVLETLFETDKIYLTEKVFKPMVMNQPFILYGPPGSLRYLKSYGFKTFPSLVNESYDEIVDPTERLRFINNEIKKLNQLNQNEFLIKVKDCHKAVLHNRRWFFSKTFQKNLIDELTSNMKTALAIQRQMDVDYPGGPWLNLNQKINEKQKFRPKHWTRALTKQKTIYQQNPAVFNKIQTLYPDVFK